MIQAKIRGIIAKINVKDTAEWNIKENQIHRNNEKNTIKEEKKTA